MKKYKCMNIGNCDNANEGKEFEIAEGEELKCPKCGSDMIVEVKTTPWGKYAAIAAAVVVLGGGAAFFALSGGDDATPASQPEQPVVEQPAVEPSAETPSDETAEPKAVTVETLSLEAPFSMTVGDTHQLTLAVAPQNHEETLTFQTSDESVATVTSGGEVKAVKAGNATITVTTDKSGKQATVEVTVKAKDKTGTTPVEPRQPSWGKYEGARNSQGLPHGNGVLRITRSHTINGETAQPGERIEGVFRNGYVNMGSWYKNDGNVVVVKDLKVL